jgi:hypothetical protein
MGLFLSLILWLGFIGPDHIPPYRSLPLTYLVGGVYWSRPHTPIPAPSSYLSCGWSLLVLTTYPHMGPFISVILWLEFISPDHIPPYGPLHLRYLVAGVYWSRLHSPIWAPSSHLSFGWGLLVRTTYPHMGLFLSLILWLGFIGPDHIPPYRPLPLTYLVGGVYWSRPHTPIPAPSSHLSCGWSLLVLTTYPHMGLFISVILWRGFIGPDYIAPYGPLPLTYLVAGVYWSGPHTPIWASSSHLSCGWGLLARTTHPHASPFLSLILWVEFIGLDHIFPYRPLSLIYLVAGVYWSIPHNPIWAPSPHLSCGWGLLVRTTYPHMGLFLSLILWLGFIGPDHIPPYRSLPLTYLVAGVY